MAQMTITASTPPGIIGQRLMTKKAAWAHDATLAAPVRCGESPTESVFAVPVMFIGQEYLIRGSTNAYIRSSVSTTTA